MHPSSSNRSRIGPFALEAPLGGSESNVLRGLHLELKRAMAVKLVDPHVLKNAIGGGTFMEDVKRLQKLDHPGIARVLGGAVEQGQPYLALELVEGESLADRLERRGRLAWETAVEIAEGISAGLEYLHGKGVVHRRLTPSHVLLVDPAAAHEGDGGLVKLTGFDTAWSDNDEVLGLRTPIEVAHYLSPEQFRGRSSRMLPACDLFSLGVILYRSLTGEFPWPATTAAELIEARRAAPAPRVSATMLNAPVWLDALTAKLLAVKRSERFATAEEAHRAIVNARRKADAGVGAAQHGWSGQQGALSVNDDREELKKIRRRQATRNKDSSPFYERAWFLALCLAGLVGVGTWFMWPASEEALYAKAAPLMASDKPVDWKAANTLYLNELRERFPDTKYANELAAFDERYALDAAMEKVKNHSRFNRPADSEAERRFAAAWRYEQFGDRLTAWQKYEAVTKLFSKSEEEEDRTFAKLASQHSRAIVADSGGQPDQAAFIEQKLAEAEQLAEEGDLLEARRVLSGVESLYGGNAELAPLVDRAVERLRELDAGN